MSFILSDYLKSVTAIGIKSENSTLSWVATGFYIQKMIGDENKIFLVSNKHVFQNKNSISVQLYSKNPVLHRGYGNKRIKRLFAI